MSPLHAITVLTCGDSARVRVRGEVDITTAPEVDAALRDVEAPSRRVALDLSGLTFIDSVGVALLLAHTRRAAQIGFTLRVIPPGPAAARALDVAGVWHVLPIVDAPRGGRHRKRRRGGGGMTVRR
jgi:anti-sigma B factor antagonist